MKCVNWIDMRLCYTISVEPYYSSSYPSQGSLDHAGLSDIPLEVDFQGRKRRGPHIEYILQSQGKQSRWISNIGWSRSRTFFRFYWFMLPEILLPIPTWVTWSFCILYFINSVLSNSLGFWIKNHYKFLYVSSLYLSQYSAQYSIQYLTFNPSTSLPPLNHELGSRTEI